MRFSEMPEDYHVPPTDWLDSGHRRITRFVEALLSVVVGIGFMAVVLWVVGVTPPIVLSLLRGH